MRTLVAILALTPALLHAQVKSPAQPVSTPVLRSSLVQPIDPSSNPASAPADRPTTALRVTTGVTPPRLIHSVDLAQSNFNIPQLNIDRTVVIDMTVDETGKPENLKVVRTADLITDQAVLSAVAQYRYEPGTVSGQKVAVPVTLEYNIKHDAR
jgi:TonB family protein